MVKFKISQSLKAGKIYYIARSSIGTIRRETLEELEKAIEEYNKNIDSGKIQVEELPKAKGEADKARVVKIEAEAESSGEKEPPSGKNKTPSKKKKLPRRFSGFQG